ncbi:MAG TPA: deoxyribodipyrimidine photo-lyase [Solirubrobacteraceae bacterium]|jgi:deoxyribodipyrimidine photo-lyase|nr:deoxyribodipyrimidine photo-lyase [Solirubrobacteraceae bacterium]
MASTCCVWLRRDLRVADHPALSAAVDRADRVVCVFCVDDRLLTGRSPSGPRTQFMLECLADVDRSLRERGSRLVVRRGLPEVEIPRLAAAVGAGEIHFTRDATPYARARGRRVTDACAAAGIRLVGHPGLLAVDDPAAVVTGSGTAYQVFTPFHRRWLAEPRRAVLDAPGDLGGPVEIDAGRIPGLSELGLSQQVSRPQVGGERAARARLDEFRSGGLGQYADGGHDRLADDGTSRLSAYLRFGCISPRQVEDGVDGSPAGGAVRRQVCWRDFYLDLLRRHPANARLEQQEARRGIAWRDAPEDLRRWQDGLTGYPLVDAGMRQLQAEGFMHNRTRMVVGSFLTKHLGIDWREGERWFMSLLLDGDPAVNNGNWQWIASVGSDPQPVGRRLLSPTRQQERFDPDGVYVRRWVPELRGLPNAYLAEPWRMPVDLGLDCGCVVGRDYPQPIVDHARARADALARYAAAGR